MKKILSLAMFLILMLSFTGCTNKNSMKVDNTKVTVSDATEKLYSCKTSYIGDSSSVSKILNELNIRNELSEFTIELDTEKEPYVITLVFNDRVTDTNKFNKTMKNKAVIVLALVENAGKIDWKYSSSDGVEHLEELTAAEATNIVGRNIKDFSIGEAQLEGLLNKLSN